jgi:hypothetical protein
MRIKANIEPLKGKYYGTEIKLDLDGEEHFFKIWIEGLEFSERELKNCNDCKRRQLDCFVCFDHFHTEYQVCYDVCKAIVDKINGIEV